MKPAVYICVFFMAWLAWEGVLTICDTKVEKDLHRPLVKKKRNLHEERLDVKAFPKNR